MIPLLSYIVMHTSSFKSLLSLSFPHKSFFCLPIIWLTDGLFCHLEFTRGAVPHILLYFQHYREEQSLDQTDSQSLSQERRQRWVLQKASYLYVELLGSLYAGDHECLSLGFINSLFSHLPSSPTGQRQVIHSFLSHTGILGLS